MSFFNDDFYSTKVPRKSQRDNGASTGFGLRPSRNSWTGGYRSSRSFSIGANLRHFWWMIVLSLAVGILLTLIVFITIRPGIDHSSTYNNATIGNDPVVAAVDKVSDSVVSVISIFQNSSKEKPKGLGLGSGVMFQRAGDKVRIVTNNHVIEGGSSFEIVLSDGSHRKATIVGKDWRTDLAVLEVDGSGIESIAEFGDSNALKRGQKAIAIGNPLGFSQTITVGVISSPLQTISVPTGPNGEVSSEMEVIQTDAAINEGNSGGALVSLDGKVIGINSMKIVEAGVEGLSFAIPAHKAIPILDALVKDHKVRRPYMGITPSDLQGFKSGTEVLKLPESVKTGVVVLDAGGPAKEAGLKTQDVIIELDGKPVTSAAGLRKYLYDEKKIGDKLSVTYYRAGKKNTVTLTLGELSD